MHPSIHAAKRPQDTAIIYAPTDETVSYLELEKRSNQGAQLFRQLGLKTGDSIAIWMKNSACYLEICWAAHRSGLYFTPVSTHLTAEEAAYITNDCDAKVLIASSDIGEQLQQLITKASSLLPKQPKLFIVGDTLEGSFNWYDATCNLSCERISDEAAGSNMVYSSGTTGKPKGVRLPLSGQPADAELPFVPMQRAQYNLDEQSIYLSPAPLYHAAPLVFSMTCLSIGSTVVIMDKFEPEAFLQAVEQYKISHVQMVPTMFVRLLKLPEADRLKYDTSSLTYAIHAAAPCPVPIKYQMIDWWGEILYEYYGGSEGNGSTFINSQEWLAKPGSVGKAYWGTLHICDDDGNELPANEQGLVYFEGGFDFKYNNDDGKTADARNPKHPSWSTLGDVGYMDDDGYLFLTDRKTFMIISGGVNIYPQEAENLLITHPKVADAAVIGIPNEDFGEEVKAVIQPVDMATAGPELEQELISFCRDQLAAIKCPRSVDFDPALPRGENGKLFKKQVRARYWPEK